VNYYEHHIGDYAEATAHLSFVEDAAYSRMMRKCYASERALPADIAAVQRLIGARSKDERQAVESVLHEFFELREDGWHNARCDAEIARFHESQPDRDAKREHERERQRRTRERRRELFEFLRGHGVVPPFDASMADLQAHMSRVTETVRHAPVTRDNTATQTPDTRHQTPELNTKPAIAGSRSTVVEPASTDPPALTLVEPTTGPPDCPHLDVLALWAEVLPAMPQHLPSQWRGTRADHLRARWRETATAKGWTSQADGLAYLRKLFGYVGESRFLTGRTTPKQGARPFAIELEWLVNPSNWAKVHEGKYHAEAA
jgi:uncharacterized protein YdaU (DUF1376 family)